MQPGTVPAARITYGCWAPKLPQPWYWRVPMVRFTLASNDSPLMSSWQVVRWKLSLTSVPSAAFPLQPSAPSVGLAPSKRRSP
ncbi:hypothetical protein G6F40_017439 [Rhizopus arrhizus]|nr:hypothetical protein G6F40_017439 [Rhizopus arrhizus]